MSIGLLPAALVVSVIMIPHITKATDTAIGRAPTSRHRAAKRGMIGNGP